MRLLLSRLSRRQTLDRPHDVQGLHPMDGTGVDLELDGKPRQHLYTNQMAPYVRAPHVYLDCRLASSRAAAL